MMLAHIFTTADQILYNSIYSFI